MPYDLRTRDGILLENIPDDVQPDDQRLRVMVEEERMGRRRRSPEFKAKVEAQREADRKEYDPTKGMSAGDKILSNLGAGFDNLVQGVKQVLPGMKGPTDEELREKRRIDETLAEGTQTGLGADWMPRTGKVLQFAGEVAPTLAMPVARGAALLPKALTATAARKAVTSGALAGGASGALMPTTEDESRTFNTALGAGAGAALPLALAGGKAARNLFTRRGARLKAGEMLGAEARTPTPAHPSVHASDVDVPLTTAATYGDDNLARLELAARARGKANEDFAAFDRSQRTKVAQNIDDATQRAGTEGDLRLQRAADWDTNAAAAMQAVKPKAWGREVQKLRDNIDVALRSPQGQNQMRPVLQEIARQMDELGPEFSPQHLAELRARMAGKVRGSPTDPFVSAPSSDPAYISLRQEFDNILNGVTGNRWQRVLKGYREGSEPIAQAKAESAVQRRFYTPEGTARVPTSEGVPSITETNLRKAITGPQMMNTRGTAPTFNPESERVLKGTLEALERQNILQRAKGTSTGGGGSMTNPLTHAAEALDPTQATNLIMRGLNMAKSFANERALHELEQALINPEQYYQIMREAIAAGQPLSPGMQALMQATSATTGAALPRAMQASRQQQQPRY